MTEKTTDVRSELVEDPSTSSGSMMTAHALMRPPQSGGDVRFARATSSATRWTRPSWLRSRTGSSTVCMARCCARPAGSRRTTRQNSAGVGDRVRVMETRPLSATKRWRLVEILEKAK